MISCYLGVTEPAMFGINLKYVYPFVAAMVGSGLAGMFANLMNVRANAIGVGGLPGILAIQAETWVTVHHCYDHRSYCSIWFNCNLQTSRDLE